MQMADREKLRLEGCLFHTRPRRGWYRRGKFLGYNFREAIDAIDAINSPDPMGRVEKGEDKLRKEVILDPPEGRHNFHNSPPMAVRVNTAKKVGGLNLPPGLAYYEVTPRQAKRIFGHFCGSKECKCGCNGGVIGIDYNRWAVPADD